jgi:allantoicase
MMSANAPGFTQKIDLAASRLGGLPIAASDEFFAEKENLVKPSAAVFIPDKYTDRGKWMDGWESRRKRVPGHDWCVVRLGLPGLLRGVNVDTSHFLGNHPPFASLDACFEHEPLVATSDFSRVRWTELLKKSPLERGSNNFFAIDDGGVYNYVRLNIFPDGGVARLRVHGDVRRDFAKLGQDDVIDLAAVENGGVVLTCNDMFFGPKDNLIMPGRGTHMGDGWETKRKRELPGHDWVIVQLGTAGQVRRLVVDTAHFKGNFPDQCSVEACFAPGAAPAELTASGVAWQELLPPRKLMADFIHEFNADALKARGPFTHVRLKIYPDGGVSRFRVFGTVAR